MKLTEGKIFKTLFIYSLPLILTNVVQLLFHAADVTVLGIMVSDYAVAAVGACGPIISLLVSLFASFATGANILIAKHVGARNEERGRRATGTALIMGFLSGVIMMAIALIFARDILILMKCQPEVLDLAVTYMRIYFLGMPIIMLYNFVAAILRSDLILSQTRHMMTGNTHPRISNEDVQNLYVPVPDISVQMQVVEDLRKRRVKARKLKCEAEQDWQAAKEQFERELLGE